MQRIKIDGIKRDPWFRKNYRAVKAKADEVVNLDDIHAVFDDIEVESFHIRLLVC